MHPHTITVGIGIVLAVILKMHLSIRAAGLTVTVSVPWAAVALMAATVIVLTYLIVRELTGFRLIGSRI